MTTLSHLVRQKRQESSREERLRLLHKLAKELAEQAFTAGKEEEGRSWVEIADYARRKGEEQ